MRDRTQTERPSAFAACHHEVGQVATALRCLADVAVDRKVSAHEVRAEAIRLEKARAAFGAIARRLGVEDVATEDDEPVGGATEPPPAVEERDSEHLWLVLALVVLFVGGLIRVCVYWSGR